MFGFLKKATGTSRIEQQAQQTTRAARQTLVRNPRLRAMRGFKAAASDRLQASWNPGGQSIDASIRLALRKTRIRSRDLFQNNESAKHFCRLLKNNVVGPAGIRLQARCVTTRGKVDRYANSQIEKGWAEWGKRGTCDVTGKLTWRDVQNIALETCARDGEVLLRKHDGFPNKFAFAVQLIEADVLDETLNTKLPNGNTIRMGVEVDKWDRPVAYYLLRNHPGDYIYGHQRGLSHERVPAAEICHIYQPEYARQTRAMPWLHAGMSRLKKMDSYEEAELVASLVAASKMAFYEQDPDADPGEYEGEEDDEGEFVEELEAGTMGIVPRGYRIKEFDPQHPAGNFDPFMKRQMRQFSAGAGINYVSLGNDLSEVNFSSIRFGTDEDRDYYKSLQTWLTEWLCEDVYLAWLQMAVATSALNLPRQHDMRERYSAHTWRPRRWGYVNPLQDATAKEKQLKYGGLTHTDLHAEMGGDYEEYLETLKAEAELEKEYGISPPSKQQEPGTSKG
jgi:lambda family phage portal protein